MRRQEVYAIPFFRFLPIDIGPGELDCGADGVILVLGDILLAVFLPGSCWSAGLRDWGLLRRIPLACDWSVPLTVPFKPCWPRGPVPKIRRTGNRIR